MANRSDTEIDRKVADTIAAEDRGDPVGAPVQPAPAVILDIPVREPYPTGSPQDPEDQFEAAHGFRRAAP